MTSLAVMTLPTVYQACHTEKALSPVCSLVEVGKNQIALIDSIVDNANFGDSDKLVSQRLKDLGFLPNTTLRIIAKGLFGRPPYAVQLSSGVQFSLRVDELKKIRCRVI